MPEKRTIQLEDVTSLVGSTDADGNLTLALGDGIRIRVLQDGTIRIRATNHQMAVEWLTNKPEAGRQSVAGLKLTRKD